MTEYKFDYPQFYEKLYDILDSSLFLMKYYF